MWAGEKLFSRSLRDPSFPGQCIEADAMLYSKAIFVKELVRHLNIRSFLSIYDSYRFLCMYGRKERDNPFGLSIQFSSVQSLSCVRLSATP